MCSIVASALVAKADDLDMFCDQHSSLLGRTGANLFVSLMLILVMLSTLLALRATSAVVVSPSPTAVVPGISVTDCCCALQSLARRRSWA